MASVEFTQSIAVVIISDCSGPITVSRCRVDDDDDDDDNDNVWA